jgi:hypothetical protein
MSRLKTAGTDFFQSFEFAFLITQKSTQKPTFANRGRFAGS